MMMKFNFKAEYKNSNLKMHDGTTVFYDGNVRPGKDALVYVTFPDGSEHYVWGNELFPYKKKRWKMPRNRDFRDYCCHCGHWTWEKTLGCAYIGRCDAIKGEPKEKDAYDPLCGLFEK